MTAAHARHLGRQETARQAVDAVSTGASSQDYWLRVDVEVLKPAHTHAVDSPDPGGLDPEEDTELLAALAPTALDAHVTVFEPDLNPDGRYRELLTDVLITGLRELGALATALTSGSPE